MSFCKLTLLLRPVPHSLDYLFIPASSAKPELHLVTSSLELGPLTDPSIPKPAEFSPDGALSLSAHFNAENGKHQTVLTL